MDINSPFSLPGLNRPRTKSSPAAGHEDWLLCAARAWGAGSVLSKRISTFVARRPHVQEAPAVPCPTRVLVVEQLAGRSGVGYTDQRTFQGLCVPGLLPYYL